MREPRAVLAVDLGGSEIKVGVVEAETVMALKTIAAHSERGLAAAIPRIEAACEACLTDSGVTSDELTGCGIAYAGLVDCTARTIVGSNGKYEDGAEVDLAGWAADRWDTRLVLDNDARMACVGEWKFGAGKGSDDLVTVTLGTGIGTGVVIGGRILRGKHFRAGNLGGHLPLAVEGETICSCGNRNCAEALASTWALRRDLAAAHPVDDTLRGETVGYRELFAAADNGDRFAAALTEKTLRTWATLVVALIHAYDPDTVVLTGNVMRSERLIIDAVTRYVERYAWLPSHRVVVKSGRYPGVAALLGAAYMTTIGENDGTI